MNTVINPQERKLMLAILENRLAATKAEKPHPVHAIAVERYKQDLVKLLKKLNPRGWYYP